MTRNLGSTTASPSADSIVLLKEKNDHMVEAIQNFIKEHKITQEQFEKLKFVNKHWVDYVVAAGSWSGVNLEEQNMGHVFRMFTQNDPAVFFKPQSAKERVSVERQQELVEYALKELQTHSAQVVIDAFKNGYQGQKLPVNTLLLRDTILYIFDEKVAEVTKCFANLTGATVFNELIPFLTTHIVTDSETPELRHRLAQLQS